MKQERSVVFGLCLATSFLLGGIAFFRDTQRQHVTGKPSQPSIQDSEAHPSIAPTLGSTPSSTAPSSSSQKNLAESEVRLVTPQPENGIPHPAGGQPLASHEESVVYEKRSSEQSKAGLQEIPTIPMAQARQMEQQDFHALMEGTAQDHPIQPQWRQQEIWEVDTYYLQNQQPVPQWSYPPVRWRFEVSNTTTFGGEPSYVVLASSADVRGVLYVRMSDYQLIGLEEEFQQQGERRVQTLRFEKGLSIAENSAIPFEMVRSGTNGKLLSSRSGKAVSQPMVDDPVAPVPATSGQVVDVEVELADGTTLLQRWDVTQPKWPLYSRTGTRASFLRSF